LIPSQSISHVQNTYHQLTCVSISSQPISQVQNTYCIINWHMYVDSFSIYLSCLEYIYHQLTYVCWFLLNLPFRSRIHNFNWHMYVDSFSIHLSCPEYISSIDICILIPSQSISQVQNTYHPLTYVCRFLLNPSLRSRIHIINLCCGIQDSPWITFTHVNNYYNKTRTNQGRATVPGCPSLSLH